MPVDRPILTVVLPCLNEAAIIESLLAETCRKLERDTGADFEVVLVDDGSTDWTAELLVQLARSESRLRVIRQPRHLGKSRAIRTGVAASHGSWVVTLDCDGQNDPGDISRLLALARGSEGRVLVCGVRRSRAVSRRHLAASALGNRVISLAFHHPIADSACGVKLFRRDDLLELPCFEGMHRFLPALYAMRGWTVLTTPIGDRPRAAGASRYSAWDRVVGALAGFARSLQTRKALARQAREPPPSDGSKHQ